MKIMMHMLLLLTHLIIIWYGKYHVCVNSWLLLRQCWHNLKVYHLCNTSHIMVEDYKTLKDHRVYTRIGIKFQNICDVTNIFDFLTKQNYDDIKILLLMLFQHNNKIWNNF